MIEPLAEALLSAGVDIRIPERAAEALPRVVGALAGRLG